MEKYNLFTMEEKEINKMKNRLVVMEYELSGTKDGDAIAKAFNYISYLEHKIHSLEK